MPERQSSPGEVTQRPTSTEPEASPSPSVRTNGAATNGAATNAHDAPAEQAADDSTNGHGELAEQVAEQVAAEPAAAEPVVAEPGEPAPVAEEPAVSGEEAAELADPAVTDGMAAVAPEPPAAATPTPSPRPRPHPADTNAATPTEAPSPAVAADPAEGDADVESPTVRTPPAAPAAAAGPDESAESPTVRAPTTGAAPVGGAPAAGEPASPSESPATGPAARPGTAATANGAAWFNPVDAEATQVIPIGTAATSATRASEQPTEQLPRDASFDPPTERIQLPVAGSPPPTGPGGSAGGGDAESPQRRKRLLIGVAVVALLGLLYVADLVFSLGSVPRGVSVAGLQVGGLARGDAEQKLRAGIEPRVTRPVAVTAGDVQSQIDPRAAGLQVDWRATLDQAGSQPLNPITRITSFFTTREVGVINTADERSVTTALEQLAPLVDKQPVEGSVRFDGLNPVPVAPVNGQQLDLPAAVGVLERDWASGAPVALPLIPLTAATTVQDVQQAIESVARPAVSAPVTITGEGAQASLAPEVLASALSFRADPAASPKLVPEINQETVTDALKPQLAASEKPGREASLDFSSGAPVVVPSQDGRGVDYDTTLRDLLKVLAQPSPRQITAVYADQPAKLTTDDINKLGITGEISSFTTGGFAADSGQNIKRAAEQVNGTIVKPGETFSLNGKTNPRDAAHGYVDAGIIEDGHPARGIGGGVSQVATTLYNAAYFAGMVDVAHKEHSFYISRYPVAREATVFDNVIDLRFRNDGPTGVLIQTIWTPSSLTVKMFGTKRYEVTSATGPRTNPTSPNTVTIPPGQPCHPSNGAPGFTATDTRTLRNLQTGDTRSETRTVKYNPSPIIVCGQ